MPSRVPHPQFTNHVAEGRVGLCEMGNSGSAARIGSGTDGDRCIANALMVDLHGAFQRITNYNPHASVFSLTHQSLMGLSFWRYQRVQFRRPVDAQWAKFSKAEDAVAVTAPLLFDLDADISEASDVADQHPEVVAELMKLIDQARVDIGDHDQIGKNARFYDAQPRRPDVAASKRSPGS